MNVFLYFREVEEVLKPHNNNSYLYIHSQSMNSIKKIWKNCLNIGRHDQLHYLDIQRNALLNGISVIAIVVSIAVTIIYFSLHFSNRYVALILLPLCSTVLWLNKIKKYDVARNLAFLGFLTAITFWSFYTRRSGAELLYISLACCCAAIFNEKRMVFATMIVCSIFYFTYIYIDIKLPFKADPTINYFLIKVILAYSTAGIIFFMIMLQIDINRRVSKSLDRKYAELNAAFDKQKISDEKLKNSNNELLEFNKKLDLLVKESNEELYSYQTAINDNLFSIVTALDGTILKINDVYLTATGYEREELIGKNFKILNSNHHPESFYKKIEDTVFSGKVWRGETKNIDKKGNYFWIMSSILPIFDNENKVIKFFTISVNITDRKKANEKEMFAINNLSKSEKRLSLVLENQTDLVSITDHMGNRKYVNRAYCSFFGKDKDYFIGTNYRTLNPEIILKSYLEKLDSLSYENPKINAFELLENVEGEKRWIQWDEVALFDSNKNISEVFAIGHDITELKEIEFQNANYIAQFEEMAFKNSHNFRRPLSNILGIVNMFDDSSTINEDEMKQFVNLIKESANDLDMASREMSSFINSYHSEKKELQDKTIIDSDFNEAKAKHLNWKYKIGNFINGTGSLTHKQAVSHLHSDLGIWYSKEGKVKYGHLKSMQLFELEHQKIHNQVKEVLQLKAQGNQDMARLKYLEIVKSSDQIILLLDESVSVLKSTI
jgi:PAS domain S-box-containing protein